MNAAANPTGTLPKTTDPLREWLQMGREVLERYYPETRYATLVAEQGDGLPAVTLLVIPHAASGWPEGEGILPFERAPAPAPSPGLPPA